MKPFLAGFVSTLVFHQGLLSVFYALGLAPRAPYSMEPTGPLHIPQVLSLAFWGGVWGIVLWLVIGSAQTAPAYWLGAIVFGALAPSAVALFVVFPLKGLPFAGGWQPTWIAGALLLNGTWGFGVALFMRLFNRVE